ncbi:zinc finger protein 831 [Thomomys bottae]
MWNGDPRTQLPRPFCQGQADPTPGLSGASSGQASPRLTLGPVILPQEQGLSTVFLKALPLPVYHTLPPRGPQPRAPLVMGSLDGGSVPFLLSPLLQPEGPGPTQASKPGAPTLTVNIVGALPVLSPGLGPALGSPGKVKNAGKYLCPHCGRDCLKPSVLEKHIRSHTGERPFPCATCGIAFKTQSNLYKHRRTQTHLNNARLSLESDGARSSLPEEESRVQEPATADGSWHSGSQGAERAFSPGAHLSPAAHSLEMKMEAAPCPGSTAAPREAPADHTQMASPGPPLASPQPHRKILEPKACSMSRQQETTLEKPWDAKASEGRLRKCESTDSGYLSRSDSAEQPPVTCSPLHSLSEHSVESEGEGGLGPGLGGVDAELEKKQLEERIARLISHNQAVVDDPQLDHVRPRKTVLSKQGSLDLPMPYTYKDSFHFDIRALEPGRRRAGRSPAPSTLPPPPDKARPLFFHSVPTQLSTTVECIPVTRSNSLPFVEGSRTRLEPRGLRDVSPRTQKPLGPRLPPARLGCCSGMTVAAVPSGHPRALVRQAAVEDLLCVSSGDTSARAEELDRRRAAAGDGSVCKGPGAGKKGRPRRAKMFSQEKWQVYGNETFERIYQKRKSREARVELGEGAESAGPAQGSCPPALTAASAEAGPGLGARGHPPTPELLEGKAAPSTGGRDTPRQPRTEPPSPLCSSGFPPVGTRSPLHPPEGQLEPGQGEGPQAPQPALPDARLESEDEGLKIVGWAQAVPRKPSGGSGEPLPTEEKLPSESKKLRVEGTGQLVPPGAEAPGGPVQAGSLLSQTQDSDPQGISDRPLERMESPKGHLVNPGASSAASVAALRQMAPREEKPMPLPATTGVSGPHLQLAPPPGAPEAPVGLTHSTFPPKYLLRLPQGEAHPTLPVPPVPEQDPGSLCTREQLTEQPVAIGSVSSLPPNSASGPIPGETEGPLEDPSLSRPRDRREEIQAESKKGDRSRAKALVTKDFPSPAARLPWETAPFPTAPLCYVHAAHCLCQASTSAGAQDPGGLLSPWIPPQEKGQPHKNAPEDALPEPAAELSTRCPSQPIASVPALPRPQGQAWSLPEPFLSSHPGTPRSGAQSPFPSLRAEPRLTWCCLSLSLPLPAEQKERAASMYSALYCPGAHLKAEGAPPLPLGTGGRTRTRSRGRKPAPKASELSYPAIPGMQCQDPVSGPERKKGPWRRRVKASRGTSKQKKPRIHPKRCQGSFWQSHAQLRASRLRKPHCVPRGRCPPPLFKGQEPCRTIRRASLEVAGLNLQGDSPEAELQLGYGTEERKEEDCRLLPEAFAPSESARIAREVDSLSGKDISPSARERGASSHLDMADISGLSVQTPTGLAPGKADALFRDEALDFAPLPSQDQDPTAPSPHLSFDAEESASWVSPGPVPYQAAAISVATVGIPLGAQGADVQDHNPAVEGAQPQSSRNRRATAEATARTLWTETPSSGQRIVGVAPWGSRRNRNLETPASGLGSVSSQEEGRHQTDFPSNVWYRCGETATPCPAAGQGNEKCQSPGPDAPRGCVAPPSLGQPLEFPEAPSPSIRKRSLEGMRRQTRVELSDTSSDDEDRLVIEL